MAKKPRLELICDSREQNSLLPEFKPEVFDMVRVEALNVGDYAVVLEDKVAPIMLERKSIGDLFGTLTRGMERFKKEIDRAKEDGVQMVLLIEGTMRDVVDGYEHSSVEGSQIMRTIFSLFVRHGVIPVFCPDRRSMAKWIEEFATALQRNYSSDK